MMPKQEHGEKEPIEKALAELSDIILKLLDVSVSLTN